MTTEVGGKTKTRDRMPPLKRGAYMLVGSLDLAAEKIRGWRPLTELRERLEKGEKELSKEARSLEKRGAKVVRRLRKRIEPKEPRPTHHVEPRSKAAV